MREVEVKVKVADQAALLARLAELGCALGGAVSQDDLVFEGAALPDGSRCILRVRTTDSGSLLTLKKDITNELDCLEVETGVTDATAAKQLLSEMGYQPVVRVVKRRQRGKLGDWEICVDQVEGLGSFFEVEVMHPDEKTDADAQDQLWQAVSERFDGLGLERVTSGYDTLLRQSGQVYIEDKD